MSINATQMLVLVLIVTGAIGARRGWAREVITTAILLTTVIFLSLGGANFILGFFSHGLVGTASAHALSGGGGGPTGVTGSGDGYTSQTQTACVETGVQSLSTLIFVGMTWLAYWAGSRHGQAPKNGTHRIAGIVPGAINGAVMMYYVSHAGLLGRQLIVESPSPTALNMSLPAIIGLAMLGMLVVLFISSQRKASS